MTEEGAGTEADQLGLSLAVRPQSVVDVFFDAQRVFSVAPTRFAVKDGRFHLPWPKALRRRLRGRTWLEVREHLTGELLLDRPLQFGDSTEPVSVTDRKGQPLAVDKFGALVRMFSETDPSTARHLATEVARLAGDVDDFGVVGYLAYGSLLGAVRNGRLIGHDTDTDLAYLSRFAHPADIARESFALERFLADRGWTMDRLRVGLIRAVLRDLTGDLRHIDIFVSTHDGTHLYLDPYVFAELPLSALTPASTVMFEGVEVPAPADPGALLTATYGPSYLAPDPSFSYRSPRRLRRRAYSSMGNYRMRRALWQRRAGQAWTQGRFPGVSGFATWVAEQVAVDATIVDVGCGTGGDALWFARNGHRVIGLDYADPPLGYLRRTVARAGLPAELLRVSLYDVRASLAAGARLSAEQGHDLVLYSRNLLDVMEPEGRVNFWLMARTALLRRGTLYLTFRTRGIKAEVQEPGFRALDGDVVEAEARARGAQIVSRRDDAAATVLVVTWC